MMQNLFSDKFMINLHALVQAKKFTEQKLLCKKQSPEFKYILKDKKNWFMKITFPDSTKSQIIQLLHYKMNNLSENQRSTSSFVLKNESILKSNFLRPKTVNSGKQHRFLGSPLLLHLGFHPDHHPSKTQILLAYMIMEVAFQYADNKGKTKITKEKCVISFTNILEIAYKPSSKHC